MYERNAVRQPLARFRKLPSGQPKQVPSPLNGLATPGIGTGDFGTGRGRTFVAVADTVAMLWPQGP